MNGILDLSDGRQLEYLDNGIESNRAIVLHHGSPLEMYSWVSTISYLTDKGIRAIAYTRPGYGNSTRLPGRNLLDGNSDLAELLDALNIDTFASVGWSAGGPTGLASGLIEGCVAISIVASPAPINADDLDFFETLSEEFAVEVHAHLESFDAGFAYKQATISKLRDLTPEAVLPTINWHTAYPHFKDRYDVMLLELCNSLKRGLTPDAFAYAEDDQTFFTNWGFQAEEIDVPVHIWVGTDDDAIPEGHAQWFHNHLKNSELHILEEQDHVSIIVELRDDILADAIEAISQS